ncbi:MAG: ribonuclease III [Phycisphaerales bacterium]|nr:ribonuclease III [Phycisphaerales bacterium]
MTTNQKRGLRTKPPRRAAKPAAKAELAVDRVEPAPLSNCETTQTPAPPDVEATDDAPHLEAEADPILCTGDCVLLAQTCIGHEFSDLQILERALRHASIAESRVDSNERMEFLGDAVLGLVCCELIYRRYPTVLEGEMTKIKSTVVSRQTCANIARELGLEQLLTLGKGMQCHRVLPHSLAAAAFEAVIAAVYLDGGLVAATRFLEPLLMPLIERAEACGHQENFKSVLQQHAQTRLGGTPQYVVLDEKGPDHAKCFEVAVQIGARSFKPCWGQSKKQAEQQAALNALHELGIAIEENGRVTVAKGGGN